MKSLLFTALWFSCNILFAQDTDLNATEKKYETFEMTEGDTSYVMKKYFMVFLKPGPNRDQGKEETAKIQEAHLAHMTKLAEEDKICIAGPFDSDGSISGMVIYSVYSKEEAVRTNTRRSSCKSRSITRRNSPFLGSNGKQATLVKIPETHLDYSVDRES